MHELCFADLLNVDVKSAIQAVTVFLQLFIKQLGFIRPLIMGIKGLIAALSDLQQTRHRSYLKECDIYFDTLNLAHNTNNEIKAREAVPRLAGVKVNGLKSLQPNSFTFVTDAMIGEKKFLVCKSLSMASHKTPS